MGIWIRTQDKKTLIEASNIFVSEITVEGNPLFGKAHIRCVGNFEPLGTYGTGFRTLQVLDSIQEHLKTQTSLCPTFEMPTE